ncbi:MAG: hypothetical protein K1X75_11765 [Leptospirales bacterium]|nr:hypothetical protein [Leptospirales bacterium]
MLEALAILPVLNSVSETAMDEMEFDRTRKAIGAKNLDRADRKQMMDKLASAGGQVLGERAVRGEQEEGAGGNRSGRSGGGGGDFKLPSQLAREKQREDAERQAQIRKMLESEERAASSFLARFGLKFRCMMAGITPFGRDVARPDFLSKLNLDAKRAIMECQILGNDLFLNNRDVAIKIVKELDLKNPILAELIQRSSDLYDRAELTEIVGSYSPSNPSPVALDSIRAPVFSLLRKLYYLKPFQETYISAAEAAIDIQQKVERKQAALYDSKKKRIRAEWRKLMNDIYPDLALAAQRMEMKRAEPGTRLFEDMIGFDPALRPGGRKAGDALSNRLGRIQSEAEQAAEAAQSDQADSNVDENDQDQNETEAESTEESSATVAGDGTGATAVGEDGVGDDLAPQAKKQPKEIDPSKELTYGYRLMRIQSLPTLRSKHDPKSELKDLPERDKAFVAYLLFKEFEEEYSFILTTPQIKVNASYQGGVKIDYRQKMRDVYEESRRVEDHFRKYAHEAREHLKILEEATSPQSYVEHAKKVGILESRRGVTSRETRLQIKEFSSRVAEVLRALIHDMRGANQIVSNREDAIRFEIDRDKRKRLNGKAIKDCIMQSYCYSVGLADRLEHGDLFGGVLELSEEEFQSAFTHAG